MADTSLLAEQLEAEHRAGLQAALDRVGDEAREHLRAVVDAQVREALEARRQAYDAARTQFSPAALDYLDRRNRGQTCRCTCGR